MSKGGWRQEVARPTPILKMDGWESYDGLVEPERASASKAARPYRPNRAERRAAECANRTDLKGRVTTETPKPSTTTD